ncbi:MAG: DUF805 domain-containing protein [Hellea sp.]|nr:DUF805 domain-containing protein [Hellea sp.]
MKNLLLTLKGGIGRQDFWIGFAIIAILTIAFNALISRQPIASAGAFWIPLIYLPVIIYMIICVYCKRLTDMGKTRWVFTGAIGLEILVIIMLMLAFGGVEYFSAYAEFERKDEIEETVKEAINAKYKAVQAANMHIIKPAMYIVPLLLTLWLAIAPSKPKSP